MWRTPKNIRGGGLACVTTGALRAKLGERILAHKAPVMQAREASREASCSHLQSFHFRFRRKMGIGVTWLVTVTVVSHYFGWYLTGEFSATIKKGFPRLWLEQTQSAKKSYSVILIMWNYRKCMGKSRFSKNWSRNSLHSSFNELLLWTSKLRFSKRKHQTHEFRKK